MPQLNRKLTLYGLTMIAVGSCIGSGIFVTPAKIAQEVPHASLILIVWALGGIIALTGALTFAELGGMFPKAGGVYVFLKEAFGELTAFLYGWVTLLVITSGALAALGLAFAEYMTFFIDLGEHGKIMLAVGTIILLTGINIFGVDVSQLFSNIFTGLKLGAMLAIVIAGFAFYNAEKVPLSFSMAENLPENLTSAILAALIGVLWSFGGWHHASYLAGETINPKRNVPRAMVYGALIVTAIYMLINLAYMMLLPIATIAGTERVAGDAVATLLSSGGKLVAVMIAISIFGTISIYTMSAPRIYFAMAKDGVFFKQLAIIHPKYKTPANAMLLQSGWAICLLFFWGTFHNLITYVTFMDIVFMTMAASSIFIFRNKRKDVERPYKTFAYPVVPIIFILISAAFVVNTLIEKPTQAMAGLGLLALGVVVYFIFKNMNQSDTKSS